MSWLTKRIPTLLGVLLLTLVVAGIYYFLNPTKPKVESSAVPQKVRITNVADNKFSVSWITTGSTQGYVEYGVVGEKLVNKANDERETLGESGTITHHVTVTGLQPLTQYAFRIVDGAKGVKFDNEGSPYTVMTGPVIGGTPPSRNFYGKVELPSKQSPEGALVYVALPGGTVASTTVSASGNYAVTLSTIRTADLRGYVQVDPAATIATVTIESGKEQSVATVTLANATPVPTITLGQDADFRKLAEESVTTVPNVSEVQPTAETPSIFNVEPLSTGNEINLVGSQVVNILNPGIEGETLATLRPEFRGTGPKGTTLSIAITGHKSVSDTTLIAADGTWSYAPKVDLKAGSQILTISYLGSGGTEQKVSRGFVVTTASAGTNPAFVATPSASKKASPSPTQIASQRAAMPATDSGIPVTGVLTNTIVTMIAGMAVLAVGVFLLL